MKKHNLKYKYFDHNTCRASAAMAVKSKSVVYRDVIPYSLVHV
jgi:hypothetical protein